jgi:hypothetical protein
VTVAPHAQDLQVDAAQVAQALLEGQAGAGELPLVALGGREPGAFRLDPQSVEELASRLTAVTPPKETAPSRAARASSA